MKGQRVGFPLIVGFVADHLILSAQAAQTVQEVLRQLRERSPGGVLVTTAVRDAQLATEQAGISWESLSDDTAGGSHSGQDASESAQIGLVEASDLVLIVSSAVADNSAISHLLVLARSLARPVLRLDENGVLMDKLPPRIESETGWLADLFRLADLSPNDSLETIQARMDALANRAAPITRRWWKWILFLQGITVLVPLTWLVQRLVLVRIEWVALMTFVTVVLLVAVNWWLRWRGMQKTWARARLVAEVARSLLATAACPIGSSLQILAEVPSLRPLRWLARRRASAIPFPEWRQLYLEKRIDDQEKYFREKQRQSEQQRKQLTRWATLLLDIALAFAFAGAVVSFAPDARGWLRMLGDFRLEIVLGVAGATMPLGLLLVQLLRGVQEVNRRTARFAQQRQMLQQARARLANLSSPAAAMEVIAETERQLLAEVLEWYFHAETAEHFFLSREADKSERTARAVPVDNPSAFYFVRRTVGITSVAGLFLLRVVMGRIPWIVASGAAALMWIAYHQPSDVATRDQLKPLARLADRYGKDWIPDPAKLAHGCVIIVHGLYGDIGSELNASKGWPKACAAKIADAMGDNAPDVCVVDWHEAAQTAHFNNLNVGFGLFKQEDLFTDLAGVRTQAEEVGNLLAFRLAMMIMDDKNPTIRRDEPLHLIGHSAGGFIVARVAVLLKKFHAAPRPLHVTILDTPAPTSEITMALPNLYPDGTVDFYISSVMGGRQETFRAADFSPKIRTLVISSKVQASQDKNFANGFVKKLGNLWVEHRYSFEWYMETIDHPEKFPNEGFNRSPLRPVAFLP